MLTACNAPKSSLTYFEDLSGTQSGTLPSTDYEIKLRPDDELLITVTSLVPEATAEYNLPLSNPATQNNIMTPSQGKQQTYIVDKSGDIKFPGIGMLHVDGMTTSQLASLLVKKNQRPSRGPLCKSSACQLPHQCDGRGQPPGFDRCEPRAILDTRCACRCRRPDTIR